MKDKMPLGFKIYLAFGVFGSIWQILDISKGKYFDTSYYGFVLPKETGLLISTFYLALGILILLAIIKRYTWGWKLILYSSILSVSQILLALLNTLIKNPSTIIFTVIFYSITILITILVTRYFYKNRGYFNRK